MQTHINTYKYMQQDGDHNGIPVSFVQVTNSDLLIICLNSAGYLSEAYWFYNGLLSPINSFKLNNLWSKIDY